MTIFVEARPKSFVYDPLPGSMKHTYKTTLSRRPVAPYAHPPRECLPVDAQNHRGTTTKCQKQGHVVYLKDPEVFWENVGGSLTLPLLPLQTFDIDIGDTARIESIRIVDGQVRGVL